MLYGVLIPFRFQIEHFLSGLKPSTLQGMGLRRKIYDLFTERLHFHFFFSTHFLSPGGLVYLFLNINTFPLVSKIGF